MCHRPGESASPRSKKYPKKKVCYTENKNSALQRFSFLTPKAQIPAGKLEVVLCTKKSVGHLFLDPTSKVCLGILFWD